MLFRLLYSHTIVVYECQKLHIFMYSALVHTSKKKWCLRTASSKLVTNCSQAFCLIKSVIQSELPEYILWMSANKLFRSWSEVVRIITSWSQVERILLSYMLVRNWPQGVCILICYLAVSQKDFVIFCGVLQRLFTWLRYDITWHDVMWRDVTWYFPFW